ncbi:hypothetical protein HTZ97_16565 [Desulfuromonas acetoxidans]|uniref:Uncharacterized protein n=1 Tax=Desulfuromonas acetoxidans (strain DSM 684 / 11070) TaxID=281689 RepID=Q1K084_DESA6|nr:hypothetical protein [Desulfuromonas acetoxidans]EAT16057.1 hypothetical protein Dace_2358 [Desulfuromonas acetoxidans DSM 684]MBF0647080.1 hypothetical protein [Desulfuromonas acetoxidans]NVD26207.1 hypothetical protein [Desulfuromonas acetoxidans]NVE18071.1 hypothetical protein [Desulfuromonas acetoxidans]
MPATLIFRETTSGLGGAATATELSATALYNLFDKVTKEEAAAGDIEYRAVDIYNNGDEAAVEAEFYMNTETSSADSSLDAGIEDTPANAIDSTKSIADESTAPTTVTFGHYNTASKLTLPDIPVGSSCRLWLKRIITAGATNTSNDAGELAVDYA